jgi:hypothetical protein
MVPSTVHPMGYLMAMVMAGQMGPSTVMAIRMGRQMASSMVNPMELAKAYCL